MLGIFVEFFLWYEFCWFSIPPTKWHTDVALAFFKRFPISVLKKKNGKIPVFVWRLLSFGLEHDG